MTPELITRVVGLVKAKGDRVVLADSATGNAVVIIGLDEYERLASVPESAAAPVKETVAGSRSPFTYTPAVAPAPRPAPQPTPFQAARLAELAAKTQSSAQAVKVAVEPRVEAPLRAPEIPARAPTQEPQKIAQPSENPFVKKAKQLGVPPGQNGVTTPDLTQAELLDKINRDIGDWKTAQERKRAEELTSVARGASQVQPDAPVEEEERFYLEPIE